jgi:CheY-like chemotaxis protein/HPt (histidine-containing phosphotransfer) domain-containing protein
VDSTGDEVVLHFSVVDTGIGLSEAQKSRLFQPFSQGDASTARKYGGTGLGLAIARQLVGMMGGRIWVESVFGEGSTFHFTVRLHVADSAWQERLLAASTAASADAGVALPAGLRVLLAEDNRFNQEMVLEILGDAGVAVDVVENGQEALQRLREHDYSLVLMDMMMPEVDGLEATRRIRAEARWQALPIVALTANAGVEDRQRCIDAGMNAVLTKPFESSDLYRVLQRLAVSLTATPAAATSTRADAPETLPPLPGIDGELLLRRMRGRVASVRRLLALFEQQYAEAAARVRALLAEENYGELHLFAHTLKGSAGGLAAGDLQDAALRLESAARQAAENGDATAVGAAVEALLPPLQQVLRGLRGLADA